MCWCECISIYTCIYTVYKLHLSLGPSLHLFVFVCYCLYLSRFVPFCLFLSLSRFVSVCPYLLLITHYYLLLTTTYYLLLTTTYNYNNEQQQQGQKVAKLDSPCLSLFVPVHFCPFLSFFVPVPFCFFLSLSRFVSVCLCLFDRQKQRGAKRNKTCHKEQQGNRAKTH